MALLAIWSLAASGEFRLQHISEVVKGQYAASQIGCRRIRHNQKDFVGSGRTPIQSHLMRSSRKVRAPSTPLLHFENEKATIATADQEVRLHTADSLACVEANSSGLQLLPNKVNECALVRHFQSTS